MRALVASIVATVQLAASTARADDAAEALRELDRGVVAFRAGRFADAHRAFAAAHRLAPDRANPYRWLALTEVQLGDCRAASAHAAEFLARVADDDPRAPELIRLRELCERTGALTIESTPPRVRLRIDGADVGSTPYRSLSMRAGAHTLVAEQPGFRAASRTIELAPGAELTVHLALERDAAPVTRRWWFWTAIAGGAAVAAGAVVLLTRDPDTTVLPPIRCDDGGCAP